MVSRRSLLRWSALALIAIQLGCELIAGIRERPLEVSNGTGGSSSSSSSSAGPGGGGSSTASSSSGSSSSSTSSSTGGFAMCPATPCTGQALEPSYPAAVLADQPAGYWRFEEPAAPQPQIAKDETGQHDGDVVSQVLFEQPGAFPGSKAALFEGGLIEYPPGVFDYGSTSFTIEFWINPLVIDDEYRWIFGKGESNKANSSVYLHEFPAGPTFQFIRQNAVQNVLTLVNPAAPKVGAYTHVAVIFDAEAKSAQVLYDGARIDFSPSAVGDCSSPNHPFAWGHLSNLNAGSGLFATLDEAAIYDKALPCERICDHYLAGVGPK
jgi:hypothetical protein